MRSLRSQVSLAAVALLLGLLVVIQLRAQSAGSSLDTKSIQDLTVLIGTLNQGNDVLRQQVDAERAAVAQEKAVHDKGESDVGQLQSDVARLRAWAGMDGMSGTGVRVSVSGKLPPDAVEDLLNELWNAGAEGIAVGGVRIAPGTTVSGSAGKLTVSSTALGSPFYVDAVGSGDSLAGSLSRPGGILSQLGGTYAGVQVGVVSLGRVVLPAANRSLIPQDGRPSL